MHFTIFSGNSAVFLNNDSRIMIQTGSSFLKQRKYQYDPQFLCQRSEALCRRSWNRFSLIETSVGKLGVLVCWDQWYPEAARLMAMKGAELLIYPTAIGWESSDTEEEKKRQLGAWVTVQRGHAVANGLPVVTVNRVGHEADPSRQTNGIQFWGNSFVAGPQGELLAELSNNDEEIRIVEIDKTRSENVRRWWPFFRDRRIDAFGGLTERFLI